MGGGGVRTPLNPIIFSAILTFLGSKWGLMGLKIQIIFYDSC